VVHVLAHLPPGAQLLDSVPHLRDTLPDGVHLLSTEPLHLTAGGYASEMRFAVFRPVTTHLPSLVVLYRADGAVDTLASAPIAVTVVPIVPGESGALRDIKGLDATPLTAFSVAGGTACLIAVLFLVRSVLRRRHAKAHAPGVVAPIPTAYDRAVAALDAMAVTGLPDPVDVVRLYERATDVVREYIDAMLALPALERTTPEILRALPPSRLRDGGREALRTLLMDADLVKFARERPAPGAAAAFVRQARGVVDALRDLAPPAA
jgi:hypothetical protein